MTLLGNDVICSYAAEMPAKALEQEDEADYQENVEGDSETDGGLADEDSSEADGADEDDSETDSNYDNESENDEGSIEENSEESTEEEDAALTEGEEVVDDESDEVSTEESELDTVTSDKEVLADDVPEGEDDPQIGRALGLYEEGFFSDDLSVSQQEIDDGTIQMAEFNTLGTYYHNDRFNGYEIKKGIDVSRHNGSINWSAVKADGIDFAFIRIGFRGYGSTGSLNMDDKYLTNIKQAKNAGIKVGVYIFSQAISNAEAAQEAKYVLDHLGGYSLDLPIVMDYEFASTGEGEIGRLRDAVTSGKINRNSMTEICNTFCSTVRNAGYQAALYGNKYMFSTYIYADRISSNNNKIWLANYTNKTDYAGAYTFWQCSSKEHVNGIAGNVDLDFWYVGPKTYTISYSGNGATSGSVKKQSTLLPGKDVTLRTNKFVRKGYRFTGWNTKADGTGTAFSEGQIIPSPVDKGGVTFKLYAQWEIITYTLSYNLNYVGAVDVTGNPTTYNIKTATFKLKKPVRTGYTFKGWYTNKKCTKKITKIAKGTTGNKTIYAKWAINKYKILYYGNGASKGNVKAQTCKYGTYYSIRSNKFKRKGYHFEGWSTSKIGEVVYNPGDRVNSLRTANGAKVKLYAVWKPVEYKITYNMGYEPDAGEGDSEADGGEEPEIILPDNGGNPYIYTIRTDTIVLRTPVREGYIFKGWYSDSRFTKKISKISKGSTGNKTIYAKWIEE